MLRRCSVYLRQREVEGEEVLLLRIVNRLFDGTHLAHSA